MDSTRITERLARRTFRQLIREHELGISSHALDRLSTAQRAQFAPEALLTALRRETPCLVGRQENGRLAVYYQRKNSYLKIIVAQTAHRLEVVTFINTRTLPSLERP